MDHANTTRLGVLLGVWMIASALPVFGAACTSVGSSVDGAAIAHDAGSMRDGRRPSSQSAIESPANARDASHVPDDRTVDSGAAAVDASGTDPVVDAEADRDAEPAKGGCAPGVFDESRFDNDCFQ